ncbi:tyrosine-type recombinase/integrase [Paraburkholderia sp. MPAMCS5]|uniref:tyrosine-type recombinase/integrase n=1 Tax=Paraburkholderia sp. MPAMCS5 TaxID=3112563 RepID=UPI002E18543C|nr:tyrosine-type recombinase/integrase [Paraburkholderia sp. MPAMCS5]
MSAHTSFSAWIDDYLNVRRRAGFDLRIVGNQLREFARFAERVGHNGRLTIQLAAQWAGNSGTGRRSTAARRIEVLRPFAAYCRQFDPATEIPPRYLFGRAHHRLAPHIFTDDEVLDLLAACDGLYPPGGLRSASCRTIFGLIAATGLRISEATGLTRSDVDLEKRLLHIRSAKFGKSRWVPIHPTTAAAMRRYARKRDRDSSTANTNAFFVFDYGRPASTRSVEYAFKILRTALKWRARGDHPAPRIHDLRHSFVCHRLQDWYSQGVDVDCNILALSTYLGHAKVTDTYWYETASPELLAIAAQRFVRHRGGSS